MSDEATTVTYEFAPGDSGKTMSEEYRSAALARIAEMSDEDKDKLVIKPRLGWENERILLCDEADYSIRNYGEVVATSNVIELERIKKGLLEMEKKLRFMGETRHHLDHNHVGFTAPAFEQLRDEILGILQTTLGEITVADLAREFKCTEENITYHLRNFEKTKGNIRGKAWKISQERADEFRAYLRAKKRKTRGAPKIKR